MQTNRVHPAIVIPVSGAPAGYDRCVNAVRWRLRGPLAGGGAATAALSYLARVP